MTAFNSDTQAGDYPYDRYGNAYPLPLPSYAVDLLLAVKFYLAYDKHKARRLQALEEAIIVFEENMPIASDGEVLTMPPVI